MEELFNLNIEQEVPTPEQVRELKADWLGNLRESGSVVHKNTDGAISAEMGKGQAFCSYLLGDTTSLDEVDIIRRSREIAQMTVNSMVPVPVRVKVGSEGSYTDGDSVNLATDYFDDRGLNAGQKADILIGLAVHESAHILHTDFEASAKALEDTRPELQAQKKDVMNILEDERIEYLIGEEMPGNADYLGEVKKHYFGRVRGKVTEPLTEALPKFLNTMLLSVRFPAQLSDEDVRDNYDNLVRLRDVLTPYPQTTEELITATDRVMLIIELAHKAKTEGLTEEEKQEQQGGPDGQPGPQQGGCGSGVTAQEVAEAIGRAMQSQQGHQVQKAIDTDANKSQSGAGKDSGCLEGRGSETSCDYANGDSEKMATGAGNGNITCYARKRNGDQAAYMSSMAKVRRYVPSVQRILTLETEEQDYELQGMKNGKLNSNKLVSYALGNGNIFTARGTVTCDAACVCVLVDESGSMSGSKEVAARDAAVLLNEAVKQIDNVEMFVYGFTDRELNRRLAVWK